MVAEYHVVGRLAGVECYRERLGSLPNTVELSIERHGSVRRNSHRFQTTVSKAICPGLCVESNTWKTGMVIDVVKVEIVCGVGHGKDWSRRRWRDA